MTDLSNNSPFLMNKAVDAARAGLRPPLLILPFVTVGRGIETQSLVRRVDGVAAGHSTLAVLTGALGIGKSHILALVGGVTQESGLATSSVEISRQTDLTSPDLLTAIAAGIAVKASPEGGALGGMLERFARTVDDAATEKGVVVDEELAERLRPLEALPGGPDMAKVVTAYVEGVAGGDGERASGAERWLRAEMRDRRDAYRLLGVRTVLGHNLSSGLLLLAGLCQILGHGGLIVTFDEISVLHTLQSSASRNRNLDQILLLVNTLLGKDAGPLGVILAGTEAWLLDEHRGLAAHGPLRSRLLGPSGTVDPRDVTGTVIALRPLTREDMRELLSTWLEIFSRSRVEEFASPGIDLDAFLDEHTGRIGAEDNLTPRELVRDFLAVLARLHAEAADEAADEAAVIGEEHLGEGPGLEEPAL